MYLYLQKSSCYDEGGLTCVEQEYSRHRHKVADNQCLICYKVFANTSQHSEHFKKCRTKLKCKKCCIAKFHSLSEYQSHIKICAGEGFFKCFDCGKVFSDKKLCQNHSYKCSGKFRCDHCKAKFFSIDPLLEHVKQCRPLPSCQKCQTSFLTKEMLHKHMNDCCPVPVCEKCNMVFLNHEAFHSHQCEW